MKCKSIYLLLIISVFFINKGFADVKANKEIILVGASVGQGWKFPDLVDRKKLTGYKLDFIPVFDSFDKSSAIKSIVEREKKPNAVIIKECSVYFPGDLNLYENRIKKWVNELKKNNIEPILATTVPPGKPNSIVYKLKDFIKSITGKPKKIDSVTKYNEWLRDFSSKNGIKVLDLEQVLRISNGNRHLNPEYDRGDFTHLNNKAYLVLDNFMADFLNKM